RPTVAIIEKDFNNNDDDGDREKNLYLPASFLRSKKWCSTHVANALALARCRGKPSFFIRLPLIQIGKKSDHF
ncbi:29696_t:CDS:1, partial [Racocetra persica]